MVVGLVRTKLLSHLIGPAGIGVVGNLTNLVNLLVVVGTLGLSTGMVSYLSRFRSLGDRDKMNMLFSSIFWPTFGITFFLISVGFCFPAQVAKTLLGSSGLKATVWALAVALPFGVLGSLAGSMLQGVQAISKLALQSILGLFVGLIVTIILVLKWGLSGAIWSIPVTSLAMLVVAAWISFPVWRDEGIRLRFAFSIELFQSVFTLGMAIFVCAAMFYGVMQFLRGRLLAMHGEESAGYFHAALQVVSYFYVLAQALTIYLVPRMSENLDKETLEKEVNDAWRLGTLLVMVLAPVLVMFGSFFVRILFSNRFGAVEHYLAPLAAVELIRIGGVVLGSTIIARGYRWTYLFVNLWFALPALMAGWLLIPQLGLQGAMIAYCFGWVCNISAVTWAIYKRVHVSLRKSSYILIIRGLLLIYIGYLGGQQSMFVRGTILAVMVAVFSVSIKKNELQGILQMFKAIFNKECQIIGPKEG